MALTLDIPKYILMFCVHDVSTANWRPSPILLTTFSAHNIHYNPRSNKHNQSYSPRGSKNQVTIWIIVTKMCFFSQKYFCYHQSAQAWRQVSVVTLLRQYLRASDYKGPCKKAFTPLLSRVGLLSRVSQIFQTKLYA